MQNIDFMKEYRLPISESFKKKRMQRCPLDCGDGILVNDQLESEGFIKIYEYLGGTVYLDEVQKSPNVVPIAGISVKILEKEHMVQIDKIYCEFGYDEFIPELMKQIMNFADFTI